MPKYGITASLVILGCMATAGCTDQMSASLNLQAATIEELVPFTGNVSDRSVRLTLKLAGAPNCSSQASSLRYGFLFDSDLDEGTGQQSEAFAGLGVDTQIVASCNTATGSFESTSGTVSLITSEDGSAELRIDATLKDLPALQLRYVAYAFENNQFVRLPAAPNAAAWAYYEIQKF